MANKAIIEKKEAQVKALAEELKDAKLVLIVDYRGTTVEDDTKLRKDIREANGKCRVVKNNILRRALDSNGRNELDEILVGPNAIVIADEDYLTTLKVIYNFAKQHDNYSLKGGYVDGKEMSVEELNTLAQLPSREELLSKLAGSLLQTIAKLAVAVDQVRIKKEEGEEAPATEEEKEEVKEEDKAEEKAEAKEEPKTEEAKVEEKAEAKE